MVLRKGYIAHDGQTLGTLSALRLENTHSDTPVADKVLFIVGARAASRQTVVSFKWMFGTICVAGYTDIGYID